MSRYHRCYTRTPDLPQAESQCAVPGSVYYWRACAPRELPAPPESSDSCSLSQERSGESTTLEVVIVAETVEKGEKERGEREREREGENEDERERGEERKREREAENASGCYRM